MSTVRDFILKVTSENVLNDQEARNYLTKRYGVAINDQVMDTKLSDLKQGVPAPAPQPTVKPAQTPAPAPKPEPTFMENVGTAAANVGDTLTSPLQLAEYAGKEGVGIASGVAGLGVGLAEGAFSLPQLFSQVGGVLNQLKKADAAIKKYDGQWERIRDDETLSNEEKDQILTRLFNEQREASKGVESALNKVKQNPLEAARRDNNDLIRRRLKMDKGTWTNFTSDVRDLGRAFPTLFKTLLITNAPPDQKEQLLSFSDYAAKGFQQRRELAKSLVGGAIGGTAGVGLALMHDFDATFEAAPGVTIMTILSLVPVLKGAGATAALKNIPGAAQLNNLLIKYGQKAADKPVALVGDKVRRRKQLVKGEDKGGARIRADKEGEGPLTYGEVGREAAQGFGFGMLVGVPELAVYYPAARLVLGAAAKDSVKLQEMAAALRRFSVHTSAQRGVTMERAVRDLNDDASRAASAVEGRVQPFLNQIRQEGIESVVSPTGKTEPVVAPSGKPAPVQVAYATESARKMAEGIRGALKEAGVSANKMADTDASMVSLANNGSAYLVSPTIRSMVAKRLLEDLSGLRPDQRKFITRTLPLLLEQASQNVKASPRIKVFAKDLDLSPVISDVLDTIKPKQRNRIQAELVSGRFLEVQTMAAKRAKRNAYDREATKFLTEAEKTAAAAGKLSEDDYLLAMAFGRMVNGDSINQVLLTGVNPTRLQNKLMNMINDPAKMKKLEDYIEGRMSQIEGGAVRLTRSESDMMLNVAQEMIDDLSRYKDMDAAFMMADEYQGILANLKERPRVAGAIDDIVKMVEEGEKSGTRAPIRYISDGLQKTEWWRSNWNLGGGGNAGIRALNRLNAWMKANLTIFNPAVHVNNFGSNLALQSTRRGVDPVTLVNGLVKETKQYNDFRTGKTKRVKDDKSVFADDDVMDQRLYDSLDEMKLIESDLVSAEIDSVGLGILGDDMGGAGKVRSMPRDLAKTLGQKAGSTYRWGDQLFKIDEAAKSFRQMYRNLEELGNGKSMDIETSTLTRTRVRKDANGDIFIGKKRISKDGKFVGTGKKQLERVFTSSSRRQAMDLFIDYGQVPGALKVLRALGPLSLASPFLTWNWKAMGIGNRSLLAQAMFPKPRVISNDIRVMAPELQRIGVAAIRRNAMLNGLRNTMFEDREALDQVLAFDPSAPRTNIYTALGDPEVIGADDVESMNYSGPVMHLASAMARASMFIPALTDPYDERTKLLAKRNRGETISIRETARLAQLSEGLASKLVIASLSNFRETAGQPNMFGKQLTKGEIMRKHILPMFLPGGQTTQKAAGNVMDMIIGEIEDDPHYSSAMRNSYRDPRVQEHVGQMMTRYFLGLGWKPVALSGDRDVIERYFENTRNNIERVYTKAEENYEMRLNQGDMTVDEYNEAMDNLEPQREAAQVEIDKLSDETLDLRDIIIGRNERRKK